MVVQSAEFAAELKTLRKGRGIYVPQIGQRVGPALRSVCGVVAGDSAGEMRRKVATRLEEMAVGLPEDLHVAVLAALAIHPDVRQPFYQDRIRWVARYLERDERTARRRVDDGIAQLAEMAAAESAETVVNGRAPGVETYLQTWRVAELRAIVLLDHPGREAIELRRIVAERDGLDLLDLAFTLPRDPADPKGPRHLLIDVLYGGTLVEQAPQSSERFGFGLRLPRPLERGERYEYGLRFRVPPGQPVRPHHICISRQQFELFDLRLRFAADRPPERVWRLDSVFQRDVDDPVPTGEPVVLDAAGEVRLTFRHLTPGLAYGARWQDG
jgi:hypothetical protein